MWKKQNIRAIGSTIVILLLISSMMALIVGTTSAEISDVTVPVSGKVLDSNGNGLAGITVKLENESSVTTGAQGNFVMMSSPGEHTLTFSGPGIETRDMIINVGDSGLGMGNVETFASNESSSVMSYAVIVIVGLLATALLIFVYMRRRKK